MKNREVCHNWKENTKTDGSIERWREREREERNMRDRPFVLIYHANVDKSHAELSNYRTFYEFIDSQSSVFNYIAPTIPPTAQIDTHIYLFMFAIIHSLLRLLLQ